MNKKGGFIMFLAVVLFMGVMLGISVSAIFTISNGLNTVSSEYGTRVSKCTSVCQDKGLDFYRLDVWGDCRCVDSEGYPVFGGLITCQKSVTTSDWRCR